MSQPTINLYPRTISDGTVTWTSPTGAVYRTVPGGVDLFPDTATSTACQEPKPSRRNRSRERAARIARIRRRNRIQRPINEAHRRLQQARRREIGYRKHRNHMRKMLFLLKGRPSTSRSVPGSTIRSNPKSYRRIGSHRRNPLPVP